MREKPRGRYGIDAAWVPGLWIGIAALSLGIAALFGRWAAGWWTTALCWYFAACAVAYLVGAGLYWHASLRGKFVVWDRLLGESAVRDPAQVLDLGCGRGAVAIMAARRFPRGIDLWRTVDQSGNSVDAAERNAALNGVAARMRFETGDMTMLPFEAGRFGLVTASLSIHNIPSAEGRRSALREAARVLAPGGRLIVLDIRRTREYAEELRRLGLSVDGPAGLGWQSWWTGPWMAASVIVARR